MAKSGSLHRLDSQQMQPFRANEWDWIECGLAQEVVNRRWPNLFGGGGGAYYDFVGDPLLRMMLLVVLVGFGAEP